MGYACCIRLQKYLHQKNTIADKKDARCVQFLLKPLVSDVLVVTLFLEESLDQTKIGRVKNFL